MTSVEPILTRTARDVSSNRLLSLDGECGTSCENCFLPIIGLHALTVA